MTDATMSPIRLALVGIGTIARDQHLPAIAQCPRFELVATASHAGTVANIPGYETLEQLLATGHKLDAVSICTPPVGRGAIAALAIDAGLHVMIEKPPGVTLSEVVELDARARAAGTTLFTAWHSREAAGVADARAWLANRTIEGVTIAWREDIRRWHPGQDWILGPGGFGVFDPGINALSIATTILPDPITVEAADLGVPSNRESPLTASLRMRSGCAPVSAEFDFLHQGQQQWDILVDTDAGRLSLREGGRMLEVDGSIVDGTDQEYPRLYARFATLIETRQSDVDARPLRLVADTFLLASRHGTPEFTW